MEAVSAIAISSLLASRFRAGRRSIARCSHVGLASWMGLKPVTASILQRRNLGRPLMLPESRRVARLLLTHPDSATWFETLQTDILQKSPATARRQAQRFATASRCWTKGGLAIGG